MDTSACIINNPTSRLDPCCARDLERFPTVRGAFTAPPDTLCTRGFALLCYSREAKRIRPASHAIPGWPTDVREQTPCGNRTIRAVTFPATQSHGLPIHWSE